MTLVYTLHTWVHAALWSPVSGFKSRLEINRRTRAERFFSRGKNRTNHYFGIFAMRHFDSIAADVRMSRLVLDTGGDAARPDDLRCQQLMWNRTNIVLAWSNHVVLAWSYYSNRDYTRKWQKMFENDVWSSSDRRISPKFIPCDHVVIGQPRANSIFERHCNNMRHRIRSNMLLPPQLILQWICNAFSRKQCNVQNSNGKCNILSVELK